MECFKKCEICGDDFHLTCLKTKLCVIHAQKSGLNKETKDVHVSLTNYEKLYGEKLNYLQIIQIL